MALSPAYAECEKILRERQRDLWLSILFAPFDKRPSLWALYAFADEIARIADIVRDPMPGEIRLQWWREALAGEREGEMLAHPVTAALRDTIARHGLPKQSFMDLIDARTFELYNDPMPDTAQLEGYCGETHGAAVRLACLILSEPGRDPGGASACGHAGVALGITSILRQFAWHASRGRMFIPGDILARCGVSAADVMAGPMRAGIGAVMAEMRAKARAHHGLALAAFNDLPEPARQMLRPAFLPLALVPLFARRMERPGFDPYRDAVEMSQWRRQWALWRAER